MSVSIVLALLVSTAAQDPQDPPQPQDSPLEVFAALDDDAQRAVMRALDRVVLLDPDPLIQDIVSLAHSFDSYPEATPLAFHDPKKWAKGAAPARKMVHEGTTVHREMRVRLTHTPLLPDLHKAVWYDWGSARVVRRPDRLSHVEVFENLLNGFPRGADAAVAHIQEMLDRDGGQRLVAAYLQHLYADLEARVYENITLYDAWYSGEMIAVPDVDAIPFAIGILNSREYHSPIPNGPRRTALYQKIRDHAFAYRKYRTLREAAAAAFVCAEPSLDPMYAPLVPRFHYVFAVKQEQISEIGKWLGSLPHHQAFVEMVDQEIGDDWEAIDLRDQRQELVRNMALRLRQMAVDAVAKQQQDG